MVRRSKNVRSTDARKPARRREANGASLPKPMELRGALDQKWRSLRRFRQMVFVSGLQWFSYPAGLRILNYSNSTAPGVLVRSSLLFGLLSCGSLDRDLWASPLL